MRLYPSSKFEHAAIGDCGEIVTGSTPSKANIKFWGGDIPFITPVQLGNHDPITDSKEFVTEDGAANGRVLPKDSVLVCCIGSLGKTGIAGKPLITNQQINAIVFDHDKVDHRYGYYAAQNLTPLLEHYAPSTTLKIIKKSLFESFQIPLPPLPEQKRIAAILDAADDLHTKRRESIRLLDNLIQSTFLEMFGDPVTNPMGWDEIPIEEIVSDTKLGLVRSSKEFGWDFSLPYVRMDSITRHGQFLLNKVQYTEASSSEKAIYSLKAGDFLFNTRNSKELVGKVCVFPGPDGYLFNNNIMRIRFREDIHSEVISLQFRFRKVQRELEKRKSGTTNVFAVYWKSLRTLPILVPPAGLQEDFATIAKSIEQQKARLHSHLDELETLFASLQQRAFNGEL